ncbi:MAG TPA: toll/interleukin-1 receptor domain-containing protein [Polyangiaceae bacterium]|nr:toll/interleukin-1 receptor domain-containing protein [Polyangiaceae bacterium]
MRRPAVFLSYSHLDEVWQRRLQPYLGALERAEVIEAWDDRKIDGGANWFQEISQALARADVAVLLISANFLSSDFCLKEEVPYLLERRNREGLLVVPVLLQQCPWRQFSWLRELQMMPRDGRCLADFSERGREDLVFQELAELLVSAAARVRAKRAWSTLPPGEWRGPNLVADFTHLPPTESELFGRHAELELLDDAQASEKVRIVALVGGGGVGKTTLVRSWLQRNGPEFGGAARVLAWSFHDAWQAGASSSDLFFSEALSWFGWTEPCSSPWEQGQRLAELTARERTLLILDGVETLVSTTGHNAVLDPALETFLILFSSQSSGMCVLTSRVPLPRTHWRVGAVKELDLDRISPEAGRALLRVAGVQGSDLELEEASDAFGNHALAVSLLGVYLTSVVRGSVSGYRQIPEIDGPLADGGHARRVLAVLAEACLPQPLRRLAWLVSSFMRPIPLDTVARIHAAQAGASTSNDPSSTPTDALPQAVEQLRALRLILPRASSAPEKLEMHPLVRLHFRAEFQAWDSSAWVATQSLLFEEFRDSSEQYPKDLRGLDPLYVAVAHACQAQRRREALETVLLPRIIRGKEWFSGRRLGAYSADLAALSDFFAVPWRELHADVPKELESYLAGEVGFILRILGRLSEARGPLTLAIRMRKSEGRADRVAWLSAIMTEVQVLLGDLGSALDFANESVRHSDLSKDPLEPMRRRALLGDVLHHMGRRAEALTAFEAAEGIQRELEPEFPQLHSLWGYWYCDLLLTLGEFETVRERASVCLSRESPRSSSDNLLDSGLYLLLLGRLSTHELAEAPQRGAVEAARRYLQQALERLQQARFQDYLVRGLVATAEFEAAYGEVEGAEAALAHAYALCTRFGLRLLETDCDLAQAHLLMRVNGREDANKVLARARDKMTMLGYRKRIEETSGAFAPSFR